MTACDPGGMSTQSTEGRSVVPSWIQDEAPSEEECQAVAEDALENGISTTVFGEVDEYRLSMRPGVVSGPS